MSDICMYVCMYVCMYLFIYLTLHCILKGHFVIVSPASEQKLIELVIKGRIFDSGVFSITFPTLRLVGRSDYCIQ